MTKHGILVTPGAIPSSPNLGIDVSVSGIKLMTKTTTILGPSGLKKIRVARKFL